MVEKGHRKMSRHDDLENFYETLEVLSERLGGKRLLGECDGKQGWPSRGVYFFFEEGEFHVGNECSPRVVRVGTHALKAGAKSTLWGRLRQHRGTQKKPGGNHRSSVFRKLVGQSLICRDKLDVPTWGTGSRKAKAESIGMEIDQAECMERNLEQKVSETLGAMELLWVPIKDDPSPKSWRGCIERNSIALLSSYRNERVSKASSNWLGHCCNREKVQQSGLWNSNHVDEDYDPEFLAKFRRLVEKI